jgi:hypothetical protein
VATAGWQLRELAPTSLGVLWQMSARRRRLFCEAELAVNGLTKAKHAAYHPGHAISKQGEVTSKGILFSQLCFFTANQNPLIRSISAYTTSSAE